MTKVRWHLLFIVLGVLVSGVAIGAAGADILGFESEPIGPREAGAQWFVPTPGWTVSLVEDAKRRGNLGAQMRRAGEGDGKAPFGNLMRMLDAKPFRGQRVAFKAAVRVSGSGRVQPWLRVDRTAGKVGAFDNMSDRPVLPGDWTEIRIEADVAEDAGALAIGFMGFGEVTTSIDEVSIEVIGDALGVQPPSPPVALTERELRNVRSAAKLLSYVRFFHPSDQARGVDDWDDVALNLVRAALRGTNAPDLAAQLSRAVADLAPTVQIWAGGPDAAPERVQLEGKVKEVVSWRYVGAGTLSAKSGPNIYSRTLERTAAAGDSSPPESEIIATLDGGVSCRVPFRLPADQNGTLPHGTPPGSLRSGSPRPPLSVLNRETRLAGVATAWGVFQHFFPYWEIAEAEWRTDWDKALSDALTTAATDADELAYLETLRRLVAQLHDGHGNVYASVAAPPSYLPLTLTWAGENLVIVGASAGAAGRVAVGDEILEINGRSTKACLDEVKPLISYATDGWLRTQSAMLIVSSLKTPESVLFRLRRPDGTEYPAQLLRTKSWEPSDATAKRPANGSSLAEGVVYFNLNGTDSAALAAQLDKLVAAQGIVFDLRGYPNQAALEVIQHLIRKPVTSARWTVPVITRPDRVGWTWQETERWQVTPLAPRFPTNVVFLTDGRAISYAESIMGIVENYQLGEIVGATTAGTNGNVNPFTLPGGYGVSWTGMRVLKHDGSRHHGVGIAPTVPVRPTPGGIAEGRDEVLEKGIEVVQAKLMKPASLPPPK